jgi:DHA1 family bicyclomycin/chloramphenicol resistance-like MFS transporter
MANSLMKPALVLGLMSMIGPFAMDMYLPALPEIAVNLGTTAQGMQGTITAYLAAFGIAQLVYGPWADQVGRKPPLYTALAIFALGSVICILSQSVEMLTFGRIVQGLGGAAVMVIPRAIIRDMSTGNEATRLMALIMLVFSVSPMLAPLTGSALMAVASWRAVFVALLLTTVMSLALLHFAQPETLATNKRQKFSMSQTLKGAKILSRDPGFVSLTLLGTAGMASFFVFLAAAPFVYVQSYGLTPTQFSLAFAANAVAFIAASQLAGPLGARFGAVAVMRGAAGLFVAATSLLLGLALGDMAALWVVIGLLALGNAGLGMIIPTSMVMALEDHGTIAGLASSLGGTFQMIAGGAIVAIVGPWLDGTPAPMIGLIAACAWIAFALAWAAPSRQTSAAAEATSLRAAS